MPPALPRPDVSTCSRPSWPWLTLCGGAAKVALIIACGPAWMVLDSVLAWCAAAIVVELTEE